MSTLARQMAATGNKWSLTRSNQQADQLEAFLLQLLGSGVVSGGMVADNGGLSVLVPELTVLAALGVTLTLDADAIYNGCADNALNTLWGRILRAAADPTHPADLDTYALDLTSNTTDEAPSSDYFRLAMVGTLAGGIISIQNAVEGKIPPAADLWRTRRKRDLDAGEVQYVGAGEQFRWRGPVTIAQGAQVFVAAGGQVVVD